MDSDDVVSKRRKQLDLRTVQLFYTIGLGAGFVALADAVYSLLSLSRSGIGTRPASSHIVIAALWVTVVALFLIGFRFFWAVTNVRRYAEERFEQGRSVGEVTRSLVCLHFPALFLHILGYYVLCKIVVERVSVRSDEGWAVLTVGCAAYQLLNAGWLRLLIRNRAQVARERFWINNNLSFSGIGILASWIAAYSSWPPGVALLLVSCMYSIGSIVDLTRTAYHYMQSPDDPR